MNKEVVHYFSGRKKMGLLVALGSFLSIFFIFLGAPFLRLLRNVYGWRVYWAFGGALFCGLCALTLFSVAFLVGACWLVIGIYSELEEQGFAHFWTATLSAGIASTALITGTYYSNLAMGLDIREDIKKTIEGILSRARAPGVGAEADLVLMNGTALNSDLILSQMPSIVALMMILCLAYGLMMERKFALFLKLPYEQIAGQIKLSEFRVPESLVWVAIFSFLGSFLRLKTEAMPVVLISMNILNFMTGIYFLQGLAVLEGLIRYFRVGPMVRFLIYFLIVFQLFFVVSVLGFVDYWMDIRRRLKNLRNKRNKHNSGEHI